LNVANLARLGYCTDLHYLYRYLKHISDISAIANHTNLAVLYIQINQISDIGPSVQNEGLGTGDLVDVQVNPLSLDSINTYIPQLEARGARCDC
jgi:Leucine-rich repeat (LRR) protein